MWPIFISFKYLLSKRKEGMISLTGIISIMGITLGVASLIIVLSIMDGFDDEVKEKIIGTYAHVIVMKQGGIDNASALISQMERMPEVKHAAGFVTGQAILRKDDSVIGVLLKGIDLTRESEVSRVVEYTAKTSQDLKGDTIILGSELMKILNVSSGETIEVVVPHSKYDMEKTEFRIIGEFTSGRYDYDSNIAITDLNTAQTLFRMGDKLTGVGLRVKDEINPVKAKRALASILGYPYTIKTWMDLDRNLVTALALEKKMMFIILTLIIMVACFNISGSLIMMVMEKTKDIGILKAIGANGWGITLIFIMEGAMIGGSGIVLGGAAGIFIARRINAVADLVERLTGITVFPSDVYYFSEIPVRINIADMAAVILTAFVLAVIAGLYPAWKASQLDPVEAIRYE